MVNIDAVTAAWGLVIAQGISQGLDVPLMQSEAKAGDGQLLERDSVTCVFVGVVVSIEGGAGNCGPRRFSELVRSSCTSQLSVSIVGLDTESHLKLSEKQDSFERRVPLTSLRGTRLLQRKIWEAFWTRSVQTET